METVQNPRHAILITIAAQAAHRGQTWGTASAATYRDLLFRFHRIKISARTWSRHYHSLIRDGWIKCKHRHRKDRSGKLELHSNVTVIMDKTRNLLKSLTKAVALAASHTGKAPDYPAMPEVALRGRPTSSNSRTYAAPPPQIDQPGIRRHKKTLENILDHIRKRHIHAET